MQTFSAPARYLRLLESTLALTLAEIGRDVARRADEDPRVRELAPVPDSMIDHDQQGRILIVLGLPDAAASNDIGDHLHAIAVTPAN